MNLTTYLNPDVIKDGDISAAKIGSIRKSITWSELKTMRDAGELTAGMQYRITDYTCTTNISNTQSAGHVFDIIVTADDESTLNEVARAAKHDGDTYFANNNLNAWQIWYCLDNDTMRFAWANMTNGKGVIYRMIDEFNNDCPYDFKNIQFYRIWDQNTSLCSAIPTSNEGVLCYTFSSEGNGDTTPFTDMSLSASNNIYSNVIKQHTSIGKQYLNNICFFGSICYNNTFGNDCYNNTFGKTCYSNTFGFNCYYNTFGSNCGANILGNSCFNNTFGSSCGANILGNDCSHTTFGSNCFYNSFGNNCVYIKFAASREVTSPKYSYYRNNHFGNGCQYILFKGTETASQHAQIQNYDFLQGLQGTEDHDLTIEGKRNRLYNTIVSKTSNDTGMFVYEYCLADIAKSLAASIPSVEPL